MNILRIQNTQRRGEGGGRVRFLLLNNSSSPVVLPSLPEFAFQALY